MSEEKKTRDFPQRDGSTSSASEERFKRLFTEMESGFALHEIICSDEGRPVDYKFLEINPAFERLTGLRAKDLLGRSVLTVLPETESEWIERYGEVALTGRSIEFEQYSQELQRWFRVRSYSPQRGQFAVIFTDITSLREAANILEAMPAGLFVFSFQSPDRLVLESANREATRLTGVDGQQCRGCEFGEIWAGPEKFRKRLLKPLISGGVYEGASIPFERTGEKRFYRVRSFRLPGEKLGVAFEDITDRKRAQEELFKIFNMSRDLISVADISTGTFLKVNPAFMRTLGYSEEELLGRPFLDFVHPEDVQATREVLAQKLLAGKEVNGFENRYLTKDGTYRILEWESHPIVSESRTYAIARDVTERKRSEEILIQNEKMMSVGGLAAGMAHEINNPLGSILGGVQNCLRRISPELPANQAEARRLGLDLGALQEYLDTRGVLGFLKGIRDSGQRASRIVRDMLDFSRSSNSSREARNINELLDKAVDLACSDYDLKKKFDFRNIEIVRRYAPDLPDIMVYETEVEQVFLNLLKNAAQAMAGVEDPTHGPCLTLSTSLIGGQVVVQVGDNGPGMDDATRKRALEPFFTTKPPGLGTGLGLSVSFFIITENHGGSFEIESHPGEGATFTVRLPVGDG